MLLCSSNRNKFLFRYLLWGATKGKSRVVVARSAEILCEAPVDHLEIAFSRNKQILRLEIAMDDVLGVDVREGVGHLETVEPTKNIFYM